jgi:dihydrofolate reductase
LIDELHLVIAPVLLGSGEHLLQDIDLLALGYRCKETTATPQATHVILEKVTE